MCFVLVSGAVTTAIWTRVADTDDATSRFQHYWQKATAHVQHLAGNSLITGDDAPFLSTENQKKHIILIPYFYKAGFHIAKGWFRRKNDKKIIAFTRPRTLIQMEIIDVFQSQLIINK